MAVQWIWNGQQTQNIVYPLEVTNSNGNKREVSNTKDHLEHALEPTEKRTLSRFAQLHIARFPIDKYITNQSKIFHQIYVDIRRWGIAYVYPTLSQTPALVKWALDIIDTEYKRLENKELKQINNTPQGSSSARKR